jgi:hypothetical protein
MRKTLLWASFAAASMALGGSAQSAAPKVDRPSVQGPVQAVVCVGNRRSYRDFSQCMRVNSKGGKSYGSVSRYCSRICR